MWSIRRRPSLKKALDDAAITVSHCRSLDALDQARMDDLYRAYENKKGRVESADLLPLDGKKETINKQYPKTYGNDVLSYIRKELMKDIERCPMCSILPVTDLDHFWNESQYGQLAVCRLNLIPTCGKCNKKKNAKDADLFVHAYYQKFPKDVVFLRADCKIVRGYVVPCFTIDGSGLGDATLTGRLVSQMSEIDMDVRLRASSKEYLKTLFQGTTFCTDRAMRSFLRKMEAELKTIYGLNDWRTALVRGMRECAAMNIGVVENYRRSTRRTRDGVV